MPVATSTAKPASYSVYGKKWGPSKADSPASTPPATDFSAERASFSPFDERDSIAGGSGGAPAIANPSTPPSSDTWESMASAIAEPITYSAYGKKWVPDEVDAPPSLDSPLAQWRRNRIPIGPMVSNSDMPDGAPASDDSVTSTSPSSEESMASATAEPESHSAHVKECAPSETDAPTITSISPFEMEKETTSSPFEMEKESSSDRADGAPAGAGAATATTISVPEQPVTKVAKKPENYSPYGKKWGSSANDIIQREEERRKEREKVISPAGRALKTLKRLFSK
jgi:hypothetical protein